MIYENRQNIHSKWFSIDLAFGIGTIAEDSGQIADSYQKALLALQYKTSQDSPIYRYSNNNHIFSPRFAGLNIYNRFLMALRQTSLEDAKEVLLEIEQQFCFRILICILLSFYYLRFFHHSFFSL